ncbi:MAG: serine/threonine protein kinase [Chlamydiae bacterium]|nr:serine/threonine protein kinase [Chlamydiota bacterium]
MAAASIGPSKPITLKRLQEAITEVKSYDVTSRDITQDKIEEVAQGLFEEIKRFQSSSSDEVAVYRHTGFIRSFVLVKIDNQIKIFVRYNKTNKDKYAIPDKLIGIGGSKRVCKAKDIFNKNNSIIIATSKQKINFGLAKQMSAEGISNEVYGCLIYTGKYGQTKYMVVQERQEMDIQTFLKKFGIIIDARKDIKFKIALDMLSQLAKFHKHGFIHRDIKPENFLYTVGLRKLSLIDFDNATFDEESKNRWIENNKILINSLAPPELAKLANRITLDKLKIPGYIPKAEKAFAKNLTDKVDIWHLAHIFILIFSSRLSLEFQKIYFSKFNRTHKKYLSITASLNDDWLPKPSNPLEELIKDMFNIDPAKRPSAQAALDRLQKIYERW